MGAPIVIKGDPLSRWEEVQAIQDKPFIYIVGNGSKWGGDQPDNIEKLYQMLEDYSLDTFHCGHTTDDYWTDDPCEGVRNWDYVEGGIVPKWIDGDRLYRVGGVVRFSGNFLYYSYGFCIDTNDRKTVKKLKRLIKDNLERIRLEMSFVGDELQKEKERKFDSVVIPGPTKKKEKERTDLASRLQEKLNG